MQHVVSTAARAIPLVPVFIGIHDYVGSINSVTGRSMQPTFNQRGSGYSDWVVLNRMSARAQRYERGDVVVLRSPTEPTELLTKRIIALQGDVVQARTGRRDYVQVPRGHLWVEGDSETYSNDSNHFGPVASGLVDAVVAVKLWPLSEAGAVERREPPRERVLMTSSVGNAWGSSWGRDDPRS